MAVVAVWAWSRRSGMPSSSRRAAVQFVFVAAATQGSVELSDDRLAACRRWSSSAIVRSASRRCCSVRRTSPGRIRRRPSARSRSLVSWWRRSSSPRRTGPSRSPARCGASSWSSARRVWAGWSIQSRDQAAGEDVSGGVLAPHGQVGVVGGGAAAHGHVQVPHITRPVSTTKRAWLDGAALGSGGGGGVGQLDVLGDVAGREVDGAVPAGGGEAVVGVDGGDGPVGAVADHLASVGDQLPVVAAGGDLIPDVQPHRAGRST